MMKKIRCRNLDSSDGFELDFSGLSEPKLWKFRAEPSWGTLIFELKPSWKGDQQSEIFKALKMGASYSFWVGTKICFLLTYILSELSARFQLEN